MKLSVILIHGIGGSTESWAEPVIKKLQSKTLSEVAKLLPGQSPSDISEILVASSVFRRQSLKFERTNQDSKTDTKMQIKEAIRGKEKTRRRRWFRNLKKEGLFGNG